MNKKSRILVFFCVVIGPSVIGQSASGVQLDLSSIYRQVAEVYKDLNNGNERSAQIRIDTLLSRQSAGFDNVIWGYLFDYQGIILHHQGNYYLSKKYFQLSSKFAMVFKDKELMNHIYNSFLLLLIETKDTSGANLVINQYFKKELGLVSDKLSFAIHLNQAYSAIYNLDTTKARLEFVELYKLGRKVKQSDPFWVSYNRLFGIYLQELGDKRSVAFLNTALKQSENVYGKGHFQTGLCYLRLGDFYSNLGVKDSSLIFYERANQLFFDNVSKTSDSGYHLSFETVFIESLIKLGKILEQGKFGQLRAFDYFTAAIQRISMLSHSVTSESSRFILAEKGRLAFDSGIKCALNLFENSGDNKYFEQALNWSIQAKSLSLNQLFESEQIYSVVGISKDIPTRLKKIRHDLDRLSGESIAQMKNVPLDSIVGTIWEYETTERLIQSRYEQILRVRDQKQVVPAKYIKNLKGAIYLGYHEMDSVIIAFSINGPKTKYSIIRKTSNLLGELSQFKDIVSKEPLSVYSARDVKQFSDLGFRLYSVLIGPLLKDFKGHHILSHADGSLLGIPFGSLVCKNSESVSYRELPYLINDYVVQYVSTPMLTTGLSQAGNDGLKIITCLSSAGMPEAASEVSGLFAAVSHSSIIYIDNPDRNPGTLNLSRSRIHIASHVVINTPDPLKSGLSCSIDGPVHFSFSDIINLDLVGSQVFINGCQSGDGPLNHGEGLLSLGLAFALSGSRSVIQHLWSAPDRSSLLLAEDFYNDITRLPYAEGLQKAQKKYLKTNSGGLDHPYYWSGLVCYSGYEPGPCNIWFISFLIVLTAGLLAYLFFRYLKR